MPVQLHWHPSLPILIMTYRGRLTVNAYQTMCAERDRLLNERPAPVILVADVSQLDEFADAGLVEPCASALDDPRVANVLVVLNEAGYRSVLRAAEETAGQPLRARFFRDLAGALAAAERLVAAQR